jgi:hypothetical protein
VAGLKEKSRARKTASQRSADSASGRCLCGAVEIEIDYPAFWAWHDHGKPSRLAHGAAYATYIGCWRKHVRLKKGTRKVTRFEDKRNRTIRSFCTRCGAPVLYEKGHSPHMVNIPRALFEGRIGREPRYHLNFAEHQDWIWAGEKLVPLKGFPGVVWERPKTKKQVGLSDPLEIRASGANGRKSAP